MENLEQSVIATDFASAIVGKFKRKKYFGDFVIQNTISRYCLDLILSEEYYSLNPKTKIFASIRFRPRMEDGKITVMLSGIFFETPKILTFTVSKIGLNADIIHSYIHEHTKAAIAISKRISELIAKDVQNIQD